MYEFLALMLLRVDYTANVDRVVNPPPPPEVRIEIPMMWIGPPMIIGPPLPVPAWPPFPVIPPLPMPPPPPELPVLKLPLNLELK